MKYFLSFVAVLVLITLGGSFFIVNEGQQSIVTRFGKPVGDVYAPGLHFKMPFIEDALFFESRILKWDGAPNEITTKEKKLIWVDTTARWRIKDPLKFFRTVANIGGAQSRLDDIIDSVVRDSVSSNYLVDLVRGEDYKADLTATEEIDGAEKLDGPRKSRNEILAEMLEKAKLSVPDYGIEIIDIHIKRINYSDRVREKVYERMISERNKVAAQYRSEGEGTMAEILGEMEKELKKINSEAFKKSAEIKGKADADAARIYAEAYSKDADFYELYRSLESLEKTGLNNFKLVFSTDSQLYKYLKNSSKK